MKQLPIIHRSVLMILLGFAVVISVNIYLVFVALDSHKGEIEERPYEMGLKYEEKIDARKKLEQNGWKIISTVRRLEPQAQLEVSVLNGRSIVPHLQIKATLIRPSDKKLDQECRLSFNQNNTGYTCALSALKPGLYFLDLIFDTGEQHHEQIIVE